MLAATIEIADAIIAIPHRPPAIRSEPIYEIKVEDDNILIKNTAKQDQG
jgi:hypothetical protein